MTPRVTLDPGVTLDKSLVKRISSPGGTFIYPCNDTVSISRQRPAGRSDSQMPNIVDLGKYDLDKFNLDVPNNTSFTELLGITDTGNVVAELMCLVATESKFSDVLYKTLHRYSGGELILALMILGRIIHENCQ